MESARDYVSNPNLEWLESENKGKIKEQNRHDYELFRDPLRTHSHLNPEEIIENHSRIISRLFQNGK